MKIGMRNKLLNIKLLFCSVLLSGFLVGGLDYDYSYTSECLANPQKPLYDGGIVINPEVKFGLKGWTSFGDAEIEKRVSDSGNEFIVAQGRYEPHHSVSQEFLLEKEKLYTFSAWLQVSHGTAEVAAMFKTPTGTEYAAQVTAESGCWSMLKGGLVMNASGPAQLYFESKNVGVDIWADSISLQPFTPEEWQSHQQQSIEKVRKSKVKIRAVDAQGKPLANRPIHISQKFANFPLGCAINTNILTMPGYQNWFASRFKYTTFGDQMKWYSTEKVQGHENYSIPDAMLRFAQSNGINVRGHNVLWDNAKLQPQWVKTLNPNQLKVAVAKRMSSVMQRYRGKVIAWDVVNENMHDNWFETMLGPAASTNFYKIASALDPSVPLFLNEYNTIEVPGDGKASPDNYLAKIREIQGGGFRGKLAIGLEGHFGRTANLPYVRSAIDKLATAKLPIWITELDILGRDNVNNQATLLDQLLRETHAHPAVNGIIVWAAWSPNSLMVLTDANFRNLATGDVVDRIIGEWRHVGGVRGATDADGLFETWLFHGDYQIAFADDRRPGNLDLDLNSSLAQSFTVSPPPPMDSSAQEFQRVTIISM